MSIINDDDLDISFQDLYNSYLELYKIFNEKPPNAKITHYKFIKEASYREYPAAPGLYGKIKSLDDALNNNIEMM